MPIDEDGYEYGKGKAIIQGMNYITTMAKRHVLRPVLMPVQSIGRQGRTASINGVAKSLPGIVRKSTPQIQKAIEQALRHRHEEGEFTIPIKIPEGKKRPPLVPDSIKLVIELTGPADGSWAPSACANNCGFLAPDGQYCCHICHVKPGQHGPFCKRIAKITPECGATTTLDGANETQTMEGEGAGKLAVVTPIFDEFKLTITEVSRDVKVLKTDQPEMQVGAQSAAAEAEEKAKAAEAKAKAKAEAAAHAAAAKAAAQAAAAKAAAKAAWKESWKECEGKCGFIAAEGQRHCCHICFASNGLHGPFCKKVPLAVAAQEAAESSASATASASASEAQAAGEAAPNDDEAAERQPVTRIAFTVHIVATALIKPAADEGGVVRVTAKLPNGFALAKAAPNSAQIETDLQVWWNTATGSLKIAFVTKPVISFSGQWHAFAVLPLPRWLTDPLVCAIVPPILAKLDEAHPIKVPLQAPVQLKVFEYDSQDSLAALPGMVRASIAVLQGLTNPLVVDDVIPRAALKLAKGLVIMTHLRGAILGVGGGMGSGILLRKLPSGKWSGPIALGSLLGNFGVQFGARKTDTLLILPTDAHVQVFVKAFEGVGQLKLGGTAAVAAGPLGRDAGLDARLSQGGATVILSYSHSQGWYLGYNAEGEVLVGKPADNEDYYCTPGVTAAEILSGEVPPPTDKDAKALYALLYELTEAEAPKVLAAGGDQADATSQARRRNAAGKSDERELL